MAKENIARFFDAAVTDKALAEKLAALAGENGFDFTAEELLEAGIQRPISDKEVEVAIGGGNRQNYMGRLPFHQDYRWY